MYTHTHTHCGAILIITVIVIGNGINNQSLNPRMDC